MYTVDLAYGLTEVGCLRYYLFQETLDGECYAVELGMLLFRSFIGKAPAIDDMMVPCFELLWGYFKVRVT